MRSPCLCASARTGSNCAWYAPFVERVQWSARWVWWVADIRWVDDQHLKLERAAGQAESRNLNRRIRFSTALREFIAIVQSIQSIICAAAVIWGCCGDHFEQKMIMYIDINQRCAPQLDYAPSFRYPCLVTNLLRALPEMLRVFASLFQSGCCRRRCCRQHRDYYCALGGLEGRFSIHSKHTNPGPKASGFFCCHHANATNRSSATSSSRKSTKKTELFTERLEAIARTVLLLTDT